jgi:hypothetical protein
MLDHKISQFKADGRLVSRENKTLVEVGLKFELLRIELRLLDGLCADLRTHGHWTDILEAHWDAHRERLLDDMHDIAQTAILCPAQCHEQLRVKARILLDYCTPEGGDVPDLLGASICRDILSAESPNFAA